MTWNELPTHPASSTSKNSSPLSADLEPTSIMVEVALRPGVTDPVDEQIVCASHELGLEGVCRAATGMRFLIEGSNQETAERLARMRTDIRRTSNVFMKFFLR